MSVQLFSERLMTPSAFRGLAILSVTCEVLTSVAHSCQQFRNVLTLSQGHLAADLITSEELKGNDSFWFVTIVALDINQESGDCDRRQTILGLVRDKLCLLAMGCSEALQAGQNLDSKLQNSVLNNSYQYSWLP